MGGYVFLDTCSVSGDFFKIHPANTHLEVMSLPVPNVSLLEIDINLKFQPTMLGDGLQFKKPSKVDTRVDDVPEWDWSHESAFYISVPTLLGLLIVTVVVVVCVRHRINRAGPSAFVNRLRTMFQERDAKRPDAEI